MDVRPGFEDVDPEIYKLIYWGPVPAETFVFAERLAEDIRERLGSERRR